MQLRNLTIPYAQPAVFAPMAGFTDAACRHLMADHGAAWTVSEMASAKAITFGDDKSVRLLRDKAPHGIYAVQLFGAEPETMAQAIRIIQEKGVQFDILDINMGCPAPKITSSGAGSKLMQDPELCGRMVAAARGALGPDKPLTVKMRIGWDAEQLTGVAVARQCEANGADLIAVQAKFGTWLYRIAHNRLVDHYRASARGLPLSYADDCPEWMEIPAPEEVQPEVREDRRRQSERLLELLAELPEAQREAVLLKEEAGLSLEEIAQATGTGRETVKSRLRYALARLRQGLGGAS